MEKCPIPPGTFIEPPKSGYNKTTCETGIDEAIAAKKHRNELKIMDLHSSSPPKPPGPIEPPAAANYIQSALTPKP